MTNTFPRQSEQLERLLQKLIFKSTILTKTYLFSVEKTDSYTVLYLRVRINAPVLLQ